MSVTKEFCCPSPGEAAKVTVTERNSSREFHLRLPKGKRDRSKSSIGEIFHRGDHTEVLDLTLDSESGDVSQRDAPFVVGALSYQGRLEEAKSVFAKFEPTMATDGIAASYYYLALGYCRHSEYRVARQFLIKNLLLLRKMSPKEKRLSQVSFFAYQAVGFYRFFCGRYANAVRVGKVALLSAVECGYLYGRYQASDLVGHGLIQSGHVSEGVRYLEKAIKYANLLGNGGWAKATEIGVTCYKAQFGILGKDATTQLERLYSIPSPQNSHSRTALLLELARQFSLKGEVSRSQKYLDEACRIIYGVKHRRYGAYLHLRYAYNHHLAGEQQQALNLIRAARSEIHAEVDAGLDLQLTGFEQMVLTTMGLPEAAAALDPPVITLTNKVRTGIGKRVVARQGIKQKVVSLKGEDPLGDAFDEIAFGEASVSHIIELGYLTFLRKLLGIDFGEQSFHFGLSTTGLLIVDRANIEWKAEGISSQIRRIVEILSAGNSSKESLVEHIWGYKYNPLRHDHLVYGLMSRLRALLGSRASWIEMTEQGYRLKEGVIVRVHGEAPVSRKNVSMQPASENRVGNELSYRQLKLLEFLRTHDSIDASSFAKFFKISRVSATRDLTLLWKKGFVKRIGRARATRYISV